MLPYKSLRCPVCGKKLHRSLNTLVCPKRHCHNIAKEGYANLLVKQYKGIYEDKELFAARRQMYKLGFFDPVVDQITSLLRQYAAPDSLVVEAGCGEGSLLHLVRQELPDYRYIGVDISKAAVKMAAKQDGEILWCVGDLAELPVLNGKTGVVIDMLTPANYAAFSRIMAPGGIIIKIVPNTDYLKEIRDALSLPRTEKGDAGDYFGKHFSVAEQIPIRSVFPCGDEAQPYLAKMSPLTANASSLPAPIGELTLDVTVLVGLEES